MAQERPALPERVHKQVGTKIKVKDGKKKLSAHILDAWRNNTKLKKCCRDVEESELEFFDTDDNGTVDLVVMTCNVCGLRQRRVAVTGMGATKPSAVA